MWQLREHEAALRDENLHSRQVAQRLGIEEAHMLEFQQFNQMWDETMIEYEQRAGELLEAMRQRHEIDAGDAVPFAIAFLSMVGTSTHSPFLPKPQPW